MSALNLLCISFVYQNGAAIFLVRMFVEFELSVCVLCDRVLVTFECSFSFHNHDKILSNGS